MNKRKLGTVYEEKTRSYLIDQGYEIVANNYFCKCGEIDLVAMKNNELIIVEVKYRKNLKYGHPAYSINYYKRRNLVSSAKWFVKENGFYGNVRFDLIVFVGDELTHYKGVVESC